MAKALVISDIHGNIDALEAIWARESDCDVIYCAGDLVDPGLYAKEVIDWVHAHQVAVVKGNHDAHFVKAYGSHDEQWKERQAAGVTETDIEFLKELPSTLIFELDKIRYCMRHSYFDYCTIEGEHYFDTFWQQNDPEQVQRDQEKRMIFGHTHLRAVHYLTDTKLWLNPGSCHWRADKNRTLHRQFDVVKGYEPYEPTKEAHYITITDGRIRLHSVSYDWQAYAGGLLGAEFGSITSCSIHS